jgi:hypothetical protein
MHARLGHAGAKTFNEMVSNEFQAIGEVEKIYPGKKTSSVLYDLIAQLVVESLDLGYRPNQIYSYILGALKEEGFSLSKENRSKLWSYIRERYTKHRKQVRGEV